MVTMLLPINDMQTIIEIQEHFAECFPTLKIEFYDEPHHWRQPSPSSRQYQSFEKIGDIRSKGEAGTLAIYSWSKAGEVEKTLRERFGLQAQIFRKNGRQWVQSTLSDNLTLKELMALAAAAQHKVF
jgi:hypothetical protein